MENRETLRYALTGEGGGITLIAGGVREHSPVFGPMGYRYRPPAGTVVLAAGMGGTPVGLGVPMDPPEDLAPGEVEIAACGGTSRCRADGAVVINGRVFPKGGED